MNNYANVQTQNDEELMREALYALTYLGDKEIYNDVINALRVRLAQPELKEKNK
jgi:hypothetical protein